MGKLVKGTVKGHIVELEPGAVLPDGATVTVRLVSKEAWLQHAGVWADWPDLDELVQEIYRTRTTTVCEPPL